MPRRPLFSRFRSQNPKRPISYQYAASICSPRSPKTATSLFPIAHRIEVRFLTYAASICSPRSPCLGDLSFHAFAHRIRSVRFLTNTQQASVRRGPRASATSLFTLSLTESEASDFLPIRSKHLFAEVPVPRRPLFSRFRSQNPKRPISYQIAFA